MDKNHVEFNKFITKENFNNLTWCIVLVVGITEIFKIIFGGLEPRILVILASTLVSYTKMYLNNGVTKENIKEKLLIAFFNIMPIAIGAIGAYDMILKTFIRTVEAVSV